MGVWATIFLSKRAPQVFGMVAGLVASDTNDLAITFEGVMLPQFQAHHSVTCSLVACTADEANRNIRLIATGIDRVTKFLAVGALGDKVF